MIFYFGRGNDCFGFGGFDSLFLGEEAMELGVEGEIGEAICSNINTIKHIFKKNLKINAIIASEINQKEKQTDLIRNYLFSNCIKKLLPSLSLGHFHFY